MSGAAATEPRAAIVIAAYNAAATVERALSSALAQGPVEVVLVDDRSADDTAARAEAVAATDPRLTVIRQTVNQGPAAARNRGIAVSSAPWICALDADDFMAEGRVTALLAQAEADGLDFIADDLFKVDEADPDGPRARLWSDADFGRIDLDLAFFVRGNMETEPGERRELGFIKPLMRRAFLDAHDLRYEEDMRLGEDYALYASALIAGARFRLVDPMGYVAVVRATSLSSSHGTRDLHGMVSADRRLLARDDLSAEERAALSDHLMETWKEWAWRRLIDAVKGRDLAEAAACFAAPPAVGLSLVGKLAEQAMIRSGRLLNRRARGASGEV